MHQFGWLSERGRNFFYWFQKEGGVPKEGGFPQKRRGSNPGENYDTNKRIAGKARYIKSLLKHLLPPVTNHRKKLVKNYEYY